MIKRGHEEVRAWRIWIQANRRRVERIGLPLAVYSDLNRWDDFLENGHLHWHLDGPPFDFKDLCDGQKAQLLALLDDCAPESHLARVLRIHFDPSEADAPTTWAKTRDPVLVENSEDLIEVRDEVRRRNVSPRLRSHRVLPPQRVELQNLSASSAPPVSPIQHARTVTREKVRPSELQRVVPAQPQRPSSSAVLSRAQRISSEHSRSMSAAQPIQRPPSPTLSRSHRARRLASKTLS